MHPRSAPPQQDETVISDGVHDLQGHPVPARPSELHICSFTSAFQISRAVLFWPCLRQKPTVKGFWEM